jgi:hypothetical protein
MRQKILKDKLKRYNTDDDDDEHDYDNDNDDDNNNNNLTFNSYVIFR